MTLKKQYTTLAQERDAFLDQARINERFMANVGVDPGFNNYSTARTEIFNVIGSDIARGLASTLVGTLFPAQVYWTRLVANIDDPTFSESTEVSSLFAQGEKNMMRAFDSLGLKSVMYNALLHCTEASQMLIHLKKGDDKAPDRVRTKRFDEFVTHYEDSYLRDVMVHEVITDNEVTKDQYTKVDFAEKKITQAVDEGEAIDVSEDDDVLRWIVVSHSLPIGGDNFPVAFATDYIYKILSCNGLSRALQTLAFEAAKIIKAVKQNSGLEPHEMNELVDAAWVKVLGDNDIIYPNQGAIITPGVAIISEYLNRLEGELKMSFQHGLLERQPSPETATLVRQLVSEMDAIGAQFYAHHQDHTQMKLAKGLLNFTGWEPPVTEDGGEAVIPTVLTGLSALTRQEDAQNLMNIITGIGGIDPEFVRSLQSGKVFQRLADAFHLEVEDLVTGGVAIGDLMKQLIAAIQENPQEVIPMLANLIQQFVPSGQATDAATAVGTAAGEALANNQVPNEEPV